jgi:hypothetical protein
MTFASYSTAALMRDTIEQVAKDVIQRERPIYRYATVQSVNTTLRRAFVVFSGEALAVPVRYGSVIPKPGALVRIDGLVGDRHIADVMGEFETPTLGFQQRVIFTSSGTFTKASYPWARLADVIVQAGGGGGGAALATGSGESGVGSGGGGGGAARRLLSVASLATSVTVTVGAAGAGGTSGGGGAGGASSFGSLAAANGGPGGPTQASTTTTGYFSIRAVGGTATAGDLRVDGGGSTPGQGNGAGTAQSHGGTGGASLLGTGGAGVRGGTAAPDAGGGYGGGGGGAANGQSSSVKAGAPGAPGIVVIDLYG